MRRYRPLPVVVFAILVSALVGGLFGRSALATDDKVPYGIGVSIQVFDGDVTAMNVFEGSPAYKTGIRRGDVFANVAGQEAKGWTIEQAQRALRGPKGTTVFVGVRRRGYDELIKFELTRDEVYIPTVPAFFSRWRTNSCRAAR